MHSDADKLAIKQRIDFAEIVREIAPDLGERGRGDYWACCPFHSEDTPSFHVVPARGMFKCFGCGESGDVFSFVMKARGLDFREALELLAERAGVQLGSLSPEEKRRALETRRAKEVLEAAREVFVEALAAPEGRAALDAMRSRGFTDDTLAAFDIGYIPGDFLDRIRRRGVDPRAIREAGFTGMFADRIAFGIRNDHSAVVGFGARRLTDGDDAGPKYVNTRETNAFRKRRILYGLDRALRSLVRTGRMVVMEGYTDVMMAHQCGLTEAVASMGTSFTDEHLALVGQRARNVVFVFDGDEAGQRAAEDAVRRVLERGRESRVLVLEGGADPCDWLLDAARSAPDDSSAGGRAFGATLERDGRSTATFLAQRALAASDPGEPGRRERVARELVELVRTIEDPVRREAVVHEIARVCGVDRNALRARSGSGASVGAVAAPRRAGVVNAAIRSQFAIVGAIADPEVGLGPVRGYLAEGLVRDARALRLCELADPSGEADGPVDAAAWLDFVAEQESALVPALERTLMPPPDVILPSLDEAVAHLRGLEERRRAKERRLQLVATLDSHTTTDRIQQALTTVQQTFRPSDGSEGRDQSSDNVSRPPEESL